MGFKGKASNVLVAVSEVVNGRGEATKVVPVEEVVVSGAVVAEFSVGRHGSGHLGLTAIHIRLVALHALLDFCIPELVLRFKVWTDVLRSTDSWRTVLLRL